MSNPSYPLLYQINTRVWITELSRQLGRPATLDDVPNTELDRLAELAFHWVWLLSAWQTGEASRAVSRSRPDWGREFEEILPDLCEEDIAGSGFAGSESELARAPQNYCRLRSAGQEKVFCARARPMLPRLAGHCAAELWPSGPASGHV
jgi:hypothetical protein